MKYRILTLVGLLALSAGSILQAQDYDDIYYDASKSTTVKKTKVEKPVKTIAVYGEVPDTYKVTAQSNYRDERDVDEYNRRGAYDPEYAIDLNGDTIYGDTIYEEAFANTHLIERFYNPDIVILSSDDDLIELYYDESPSINLIVGSDWGYGSYYGWASSYYPWYTGWYDPWYSWHSWYPWYSPYYYSWYRPYHYWGWTYSPWYWGHTHWYWGSGYHHGWNDWAWHGNTGGHVRPGRPHYDGYSGRTLGQRSGLATNRNTRPRVDARGTSRNGISARGTDGNRPSVGNTTGRGRGGYATGRGSGNMGSRTNSGVSPRNSSGYSDSRSSSSGRSGSYSSSGRSSGSYSGGRSGSSYSSGSRSGGSYGGSSGSYSSGSSGGGRSSGGGGGHSGSSGGGGHRR